MMVGSRVVAGLGPSGLEWGEWSEEHALANVFVIAGRWTAAAVRKMSPPRTREDVPLSFDACSAWTRLCDARDVDPNWTGFQRRRQVRDLMRSVCQMRRQERKKRRRKGETHIHLLVLG